MYRVITSPHCICPLNIFNDTTFNLNKKIYTNKNIRYMKNSFTINVNLTSSKFAAYLILIIGTVYSFWVKDGTTLLATFSAVSAILMTKSYTQSKTDQATINSNSTQPDPSVIPTTTTTTTTTDSSQQG